jgi:hypothetical protein
MKRALLLAGFAAALVLAGAAPAQAVPLVPDCKNVPAISDTVSGPANTIDPTLDNPKSASKDPYTLYAWGGMSWPTYDLGCDNAVLPVSPGDTTATGTVAIANLGMTVLSSSAAMEAKLCKVAFNPGTAGLLNPVTRIGGGMARWVMLGLFAVATLASAALIIGRDGYRGNVNRAFKSGAWTVAMMPLFVMALTWPVAIAPFLVNVMQSSITWTGAAISSLSTTGKVSFDASAGDACAAFLHDGIVYSTWKSGTFGRSNGATADTYAPKLTAALTKNRAESALTGDAAKKSTQAHKDQIKQVAPDFQKADPDAYAYFAGHHGAEQIGYVTLGFVGLTLVSLFLLPASLMFLFANVVLALTVVILPFLIALAAFHPLRRVLLGYVEFVGEAVANAIVFGCSSLLYLAAAGFLLGPNSTVPPFTAWILLAMLGIALIFLTRLWKRAKRSLRPSHWQKQPPPEIPKIEVYVVGADRPLPVIVDQGSGRHLKEIAS